MSLSEKQKSILDFALKNESKITKKQAVELLGGFYYNNASKYVGEVLSRMVDSQLLKRIKNGSFEINTQRTQTAKGIVNPNQLELL